MLYLIDANVLIRAHEDYYEIGRVPQFWEWLLAQAADGRVKMPFEIYDEIARANGPLKEWITQEEVRNALVLEEEVGQEIFEKVLSDAYADDLTETELEEVGRDPFLIAYACMASDRAVVTKEVSRPSKIRGRRKVPDACDLCDIIPTALGGDCFRPLTCGD